MNELKDKLLERIKTGDVAMRPRWHFVLTAILAITGMILLGIAILFLVSFVAFALRETGIAFMPAFGMPGLLFFVVSSPLLILAVIVAFVVTLEILVRKYAFGYRNSLLYSVLGLVLLIFFGSVLIMQTPMHERFRDLTNDGRLPVVGQLYQRYVAERPEGLYVGEIIDINEAGTRWQVATPNAAVEVFITDKTKKPPQYTFTVGEEVMMLARPDRDGDELYVIGVRPFTVGTQLERDQKRPSVPSVSSSTLEY